ncbi:cysteine methyltransferase [Alteromonas pelagimontana]|uniref:Cysteine methyltransferase n=1 Tax=Alteromonas pelagimontana TaxID=1858656 RepID=A0A6M4MCQ2_9ALTE|nr:MGMT family protein [Alteromonas pelagimontana]QJR80954.1 cysteine methyltransferase [Alteromonas pelagimontana]
MVNEKAKKQIRATVQLIPSGCVASYGQIADLAGLPGRARLVGKCLQVEGTQPLPWYRVLRSDGKIAFPPGSEFAKEQRSRLLEEGVDVRNNRVSLKQFGWTPELHALLHDLRF